MTQLTINLPGAQLVEITAPSWSSAVLLYRGEVVRCGPRLSYMAGWNKSHITRHCAQRGYAVFTPAQAQEINNAAASPSTMLACTSGNTSLPWLAP